MDKLTIEERSKNMSAIRSRNTKPELMIRKWLFAQGYRYRVNVTSLPGHPDLYLRKYNTAIFVNGCFWHRHEGCKYAYSPKSRKEFWEKKFSQNIKRDEVVKKALSEKKIKQLVIWECTIKKMARDPDYKTDIIHNIADFFTSAEIYIEM